MALAELPEAQVQSLHKQVHVLSPTAQGCCSREVRDRVPAQADPRKADSRKMCAWKQEERCGTVTSGMGSATRQRELGRGKTSAQRLMMSTHCLWEEPKPNRCTVPTRSWTPLGTTRQPDTSLGRSTEAEQQEAQPSVRSRPGRMRPADGEPGLEGER